MYRMESYESRGAAQSNRGSVWRGLIALLVLFSGGAAHAATQTATGTITLFRMYTVNYSTSATHGYSIFQLNPALPTGCIWVSVDPSDKSTLAMVLAAKTSGSVIDVNYDDAIHPPWGDPSICALTLISLH